ncbi:hypothetical protein [Sphingopyxis sp.]|uniref:hypothetical protein n=1 Tax=Sphingopyxis sp. TaxID=1908224 RepID=UPI00260B3727|nr:hypothetical protein [Sphingopyxis sp.]MCW0198214.1 hypothetical protein [Sphingopyxis sp.]
MHRFRIDALPDPQSLPRIAGVFAQRAIVPSVMRMEAGSGCLQIEVAVAGLDDTRAAVIAAKLGETVAVVTIELCTEDDIRHSGEGRNLAAAA